MLIVNMRLVFSMLGWGSQITYLQPSVYAKQIKNGPPCVTYGYSL
jgi:hypothetical protein